MREGFVQQQANGLLGNELPAVIQSPGIPGPQHLEGKAIAVWGLAFKPNTDDKRDAPSGTLIEALLEEGARVFVHGPRAMDEAGGLYADEEYSAFFDDPYDAAEGADALELITELRQYWTPALDQRQQTLNETVLVDGRNIWSPK